MPPSAASRLQDLKNLRVSGPAISTFEYVYDKVGNRMSMTTLDGEHQYTYDPLYRLTKADYPTGYPFEDEEFQYDSVGNRLARLTPTKQERLHKYDAANRLLEDDQFTYEWDLNGNMIGKTAKDGSERWVYR